MRSVGIHIENFGIPDDPQRLLFKYRCGILSNTKRLYSIKMHRCVIFFTVYVYRLDIWGKIGIFFGPPLRMQRHFYMNQIGVPEEVRISYQNFSLLSKRGSFQMERLL